MGAVNPCHMCTSILHNAGNAPEGHHGWGGGGGGGGGGGT